MSHGHDQNPRARRKMRGTERANLNGWPFGNLAVRHVNVIRVSLLDLTYCNLVYPSSLAITYRLTSSLM